MLFLQNFACLSNSTAETPMKTRSTFPETLLALCLIALAHSALAETPAPAAAARSYGSLPLTFEINQGQAPASAQYLSHGQGYSLLLSPGEITLSLAPAGQNPAPGPLSQPAGAPSILRMDLIHANPNAAASAEEPQITRTNYFLGNDPTKWRSNIPNYGQVRYHAIYPGVDLVYYGNQRRLEHDFLVAPNADPAQIAFTLGDSHKARLDQATGDLIVSLGDRELRLLRPVTYQEKNGSRTPIDSAYRLLAHNQVGFTLAAYDHSQALVIDPVLVYSTYLGGTDTNHPYSGGGDAGKAIAVSSDGSAYITGSTYSTDFPVTAGSYQGTNHDTQAEYGGNAFVSKLNSTGTALVFSTYLGGSGTFFSLGDTGNGIALDASGDIYVVGATYSIDFPTTAKAYQTTNPNAANSADPGSGFVTKLSPDGSALLFSTYLGGAGDFQGDISYATAVAVSTSGHAYVTGTGTSHFPVTAGTLASPDGAPGGIFVTEMSTDGASLVYSACFGGDIGYAYNHGSAIALDSVNHAYVAGTMETTDLPVTANAYQPTQLTGGFLVELSIPGTTAVYASYLDFVPIGIAVDHTNHLYMNGTLNSGQGASQTTTGYVEKWNMGTQPNPAYTYGLGNKGSNTGAIALDSSGSLYVGGNTLASYFPITGDALTTAQSAGDGALYIAKISPSGRTLQYSSLFGGTSTDTINAMALGSNGNLYVTGSTASYDFQTTPDAFQTVNHIPYQGTGSNAFVSSFSLSSETTEHYVPILEVAITSPKPSGGRQIVVTQGQPVTLTITITCLYQGCPSPTGNITLHGLSSNPVLTLAPTSEKGVSSATWTSSTLVPGIYTVYATYSGDGTDTTTVAPYQTASFTVMGGPALLVNPPGEHHQVTYGGPAMPVSIQVYDNYGDILPGVTVGFSGAGLSFSSPTAVTGSNGIATTYFTATQTGSLNLVATVNSLTLQIPITALQAPLYISAKNTSVVYGHAPSAPTGYTITGFVNGDASTVVTGAPTLSTTVTATTPVGFYPITISTGTLTAQNYYFVTYSNGIGSVQVTKAPLHIQPASYTIHAGDPLPAFAYTLSGFVNGDSQATATTGAATITTTAPVPTTVGHYYIIGAPGSLMSQNYYFLSYVQDYGFLTVTK
jgi:hypothetical protein